MPHSIGDKVHVNKDDADWGRIAADGTITDIDGKEYMVYIPSVGGGTEVWCNYNEVKERK
jgi:hypothetical protein